MSNQGYGNNKKPGLPPGALIFTGGEAPRGPVRVTRTTYDPNGMEEETDVDPQSLMIPDDKITWVSVRGVHDTEVLRTVGERFDLHPLVLEDVLNLSHRPKLEYHDDYMFLILKWPHPVEDGLVRMGHVALVVGKTWVVSFQESVDPLFDAVLERIGHGRGRIRKMGADYLAYVLIDTLVDHYFPLMEHMDTEVEDLDALVMRRSWQEEILDDISGMKKQTLYLWKVLWAMRDIGNQIQRDENRLISKKTHIFFRDMQDHLSHLVELTEMLRIRLDDLANLYLNRINMRMNEVMKTLTIVGSIFIPLTFIAGVYGMNFQHMPELATRYGYPIALGSMGVLGVGLLLLFKRRDWL